MGPGGATAGGVPGKLQGPDLVFHRGARGKLPPLDVDRGGGWYFPEPGPDAPRIYIHSMVLRGSELNFILPIFARKTVLEAAAFEL